LIFQNICTLNHMQIIIRLKFKDVNKKMKTRILTILYAFVLAKLNMKVFFLLKGKNYNVVKKIRNKLDQTVLI
jgi:hypothetical protein